MSVALLYLVANFSIAAPEADSEVLPLRKLRLYETGVGYFERHGGVKPGGNLALPLPASHLDDALKSLVVLDASGDTRVQGIQFASAVSESGARAMAGLPEYEEDPVGYVDVLLSLEGSEIEVKHGGKKTRGTLIEVEGPFHPPEHKQEGVAKSAPKPTEPWHAVVMLDEDGGIHRVRTTEIASVRATDEGTKARLKVAAEALSEQSARREHPLDVSVSSTGQLGLGYIAESPVWRTTYRIVLPDQGMGSELQAWALVHNDTDEDWDKVALELANGRPQSFLYPLAAPRYAWREIAGPEDELSTVPQLANNTADRMWGDGVGGLGLVGTGRGGGGSGEGTIGLGHVGLIGKGGGSGSGPSLAVGDLAELSQAEGQESGSLFIYRVADPLNLEAHHSALVPIVSQTVEAESITWIPARDEEALTGARVLNTTSQTLPSGVVSFFAGGGFVGETALHRLKPKERQFVVFGVEQDVTLSRQHERARVEVRNVESDGEVLTTQAVVQSRQTLELDNRSGRDRTVYVALDLPRNAKLEGDVTLDYDEDSASPLAIVDVPGGASVSETLEVETAQTERVDVDVESLARLAKMTTIPAAQREHLAAAQKLLEDRLATWSELNALDRKRKRENRELERLRSDLDALGRVRLRGRVAKKLARQLLDTEHRVEELADEMKEHRERIGRLKRQQRRELLKLSAKH